MHRTLSAPAIGLICLALSSAQAWAGPTQCDTYGYSMDPDPKGLNVRAGPSGKATVVGKIPHSEPWANVRITGAEKGWLRITQAEGGPDRESVYKGTGWVFARLIGTSTRGYDKGFVTLRAAPTTNSAAVGRAPADTDVTLLDCRGRWLHVRYKKTRGWLAPGDQCGLAETTCP